MKKLIIGVILLLLVTVELSAQKLSIGERAPELKVKEWLGGKPEEDSKAKAQLVEFLFTTSKPSVERIAVLEEIAKKHSSKLNVIIMAKEARERVEPVVSGSVKKSYVALDDAGKTFSNYGIQFVPFCVLIDAKGNILWFGNSVSLTEESVGKYL